MRVARALLAAAPCVTLTISGCSTDKPLRLEGEMRMEGDISMSLEGPIEMKLQGPILEYEGTYISEAMFDAVDLKETRAEWVLAAFGEPDEKRAMGSGELWVWRYRAAAVQGSPVKIMNIGDETAAPPSMTVVLELSDGIVTRKWRG